MATLTITIPDAVAPRVLDAVAARHGYLDETTGLPRVPGQTKAQFAREVIKTYLKETTKAHEAETAQASARAAAIAAAESEINLS